MTTEEQDAATPTLKYLIRELRESASSFDAFCATIRVMCSYATETSDRQTLDKLQNCEGDLVKCLNEAFEGARDPGRQPATSHGAVMVLHGHFPNE